MLFTVFVIFRKMWNLICFLHGTNLVTVFKRPKTMSSTRRSSFAGPQGGSLGGRGWATLPRERLVRRLALRFAHLVPPFP